MGINYGGSENIEQGLRVEDGVSTFKEYSLGIKGNG